MKCIHERDPDTLVKKAQRIKLNPRKMKKYALCVILLYCIYWLHSMSQQRGKEVERQGKANKSNTPRTALSFQGKKSCPGWDSNPRHSAV